MILLSNLKYSLLLFLYCLVCKCISGKNVQVLLNKMLCCWDVLTTLPAIHWNVWLEDTTQATDYYYLNWAGAAGIGQSRSPTPVLFCDSLDSVLKRSNSRLQNFWCVESWKQIFLWATGRPCYGMSSSKPKKQYCLHFPVDLANACEF